MIKQDRGAWFNVTANGTGVATATQTAVTGQIFFVTDIAGSTTTTAGTISVLGGAAGATTLWAITLGTNTVFTQQFSTPLVGNPNQGVSVKVQGGGTTLANLSGFSINAT